ncbi:UDP-3-O-acylglucosamine N-acyltransferase [Posidoniimonas polymericola]|uniref:UDP-3-O-acylglucosamine N-acyltransferase n=1 Tax=Posidoniimonas polymericola TaxID=2528002 RepID=A0A5C5YQ38_9BACT|nr:UDP-3-O-(3-hydroxymyristoyl)glucosamine N-acyltransferase [Posidoniimonas polymericola]TWT77025.1 UDP-3-O-acylglucosamine N-acyltransferase [Posidoniimonas polymericola]
MNHPSAATLGDLARLVNGRLVGDADTLISSVHPLDDAVPGCLTLADNDQRAKSLTDSPAAAAVAPADCDLGALPGILVDDVHQAFAAIVSHFRPARVREPISRHPRAVIADTATIDPTAQVLAGAVIGEDADVGPGVVIHSNTVVGAGCRIGAGTQLFANVTLYDDVTIGQRCLVHSGAVIGAHGFGYSQQDGSHVLSAQLGSVEIGDDVDVGAGATIDRGVYGPTRIGSGTKIDNLVQIAHNCQIGRHNLICSQVGIAGSTSTGDYVVMGGQVGVRDHVTIGDGAVLGAMAGVSNHVAAGARMLGAPAVPERVQKLQFAAIAKLPALRKEFRQLRQLVAEMQASLDDSTADQEPPASAERAA